MFMGEATYGGCPDLGLTFQCGDAPECHDENNPCGCQPDLSEPPVGIVVAVRFNSVREDVVSIIHRIREHRASGHESLEVLYTNDLRALLATRHERGAR